MLHSESYFTAADGLTLYYQCWRPQRPTAVLGMVHGLGSHSGTFSEFATRLVERGYAIYACDLRGHGRSAGQRGHINSWDEFRSDCDRFMHLMMAEQPDCPCFLLGHSLGGVVVLDYALHHPASLPGMIVIAPAVGSVGVSPIKLAIGQLLSRIWPRFSLPTGLPKDAGSRDPQVLLAEENDPLRHVQGSARLATEFLKTNRWLQNHWSDLCLPMLILHGSSDVVALSASSRQVFEQVGSIDKEYREYPDAYHDLHSDLCAATVAEDIGNWLHRHATGAIPLCQLKEQRVS